MVNYMLCICMRKRTESQTGTSYISAKWLWHILWDILQIGLLYGAGSFNSVSIKQTKNANVITLLIVFVRINSLCFDPLHAALFCGNIRYICITCHFDLTYASHIMYVCDKLKIAAPGKREFCDKYLNKRKQFIIFCNVANTSYTRQHEKITQPFLHSDTHLIKWIHVYLGWGL